MKKALMLALILFALVTFLANSPKSFAQEKASDSPTMAATAAAHVDYTLAYPGILPDNPLYFLKAARDKLLSFLISDDQKKGEFDLLTSDKRISAAFILSGEGKGALSVTTLSKSNNYLEQAVSEFLVAKSEKKDVNSSLQNVANSILKHEEMVAGIKNRLGKSYSSQVNVEQQRLVKLGKTVSKYIQK